MTRWRATGYPEPDLFPGVWRCRFRLVHWRDDGLVAMTIGDQREGGGKLSPVMGGWHFMSIVAKQDADMKLVELQRVLSQNAHDAGTQHDALMREWDRKETT